MTNETHTDPRTRCKFCGRQASFVAPQHTGGDTDRPAAWVPICTFHAEDWYIDIEPGERLPMYELPARGESTNEYLFWVPIKVFGWSDKDEAMDVVVNHVTRNEPSDISVEGVFDSPEGYEPQDTERHFKVILSDAQVAAIAEALDEDNMDQQAAWKAIEDGELVR